MINIRGRNEAEPLSSKSERHHIRDDNLGHNDDASASYCDCQNRKNRNEDKRSVPTPWIDLPTRITVKLFATAATIAPTPNRIKLNQIIAFLPNIWLKDPSTGWNTVDVSKNDVPLQKA